MAAGHYLYKKTTDDVQLLLTDFLSVNFLGLSINSVPVGAAGSTEPVGKIIAWIGGYFTDNANGGYTKVLGDANTVAGANAYLNTLDYYVCDGSALNLVGSPIWVGANRYLPNISDSRFLMGATAVGAIGGSSTMAHTHDVDIAAFNSAGEAAHTHAVGSLANAAEATHTHDVDITAFNSAGEAAHTHAVGSLVNAAEATHTHDVNIGAFDSVGEAAHTHNINILAFDSETEAAHTHSTSNLNTGWEGAKPSDPDPYTQHRHTYTSPNQAGSAHLHSVDPPNTASAAGSSHLHSIDPPNTASGTGASHNHAISGATAVGSSHLHSIDPPSTASGAGASHNHAISGATAVGSSHLHSIDPPNTTSGAASNTENRPLYLAVFFAVKAK